MTLHVSPDAAREHVTLQLDMNGTPLGHINFDAPTTDKHIRDVAAARATLSDEVPATLDQGSRIEALFNPAWKVTPGPTPDTVFFALRHPGLGWLGFIIPEAEAKNMGGWLIGLGNEGAG